MSRSLKKGPFVDYKLAKKIAALSSEDRTIVKTWARQSTISPEMVGRTIAVHNGKVQKTWLVISLVNLRQLVSLNVMVVKKLLKLQLRKGVTNYGGNIFCTCI